MAARVPILTWHSLDTSGSVISTAPDAFRAQVCALRARGFHGVALRDVVASWTGGPALPPQAVALTFDDGFRSVLEVAAPALEEAGFRATVFAVAGHWGRHNDWPGQARGIPVLPLLAAAELRLLAGRGLEIGAHGLTHNRLDRLPLREAEREVVESGARLEEAVGESVVSFAYPYGRATPEVVRVASTRYRAACTDVLRVASSADDVHALGRLDMYYFRGSFTLGLLGTRAGRVYVGTRALGRRLRRLVA